MRISSIHIVILSALLIFISFSVSVASAKVASTNSEASVSVQIISHEENALPDRDHGATYVSCRDLIAHVPATVVSNLALPVLIALINHDQPDQAPCEGEASKQTGFHRTLFRSIISPNAP